MRIYFPLLALMRQLFAHIVEQMMGHIFACCTAYFRGVSEGRAKRGA